MTIDELKYAIETGEKAASLLREVLQELADRHHCPEAAGFEGAETCSDCGKCVYCLAKEWARGEV